MYPKNNLIGMFQSFSSSDPNALMKMQDMMDIMYKLSRIQNNGYNSNYARRLNSMTPADKAGSMIRGMASNFDRDTRRSAENFIGILQNIEEMRFNMGTPQARNASTSEYNTGEGFTGLDKIKNFLKSLNN